MSTHSFVCDVAAAAALTGGTSLAFSHSAAQVMYTDVLPNTCNNVAVGQHKIVVDLQRVQPIENIAILSNTAVTGVDVITSDTADLSVVQHCGTLSLAVGAPSRVTCAALLNNRYVAVKIPTANEICDVAVYSAIGSLVNIAQGVPATLMSEGSAVTTQLTDGDVTTCDVTPWFGLGTKVIVTVDLTRNSPVDLVNVKSVHNLPNVVVMLLTSHPTSATGACCNINLVALPTVATCTCTSRMLADQVQLDMTLQATAINLCEMELEVHGGWSTWTHLPHPGYCSTTCGGGTYNKGRVCNRPAPTAGGRTCPGNANVAVACNTQNCPIHGAWGNWVSSGPCSVTCGPGVRQKTRQCNNPPPQFQGNPCPGNAHGQDPCTPRPCPVHGAWGNWVVAGACSVTCSQGFRHRTRLCNNPPPQFQGNICAGNAISQVSCNAGPCPVDGGWTSWMHLQCSVTCGLGSSRYSRSCTNPAPLWGGADCPGISDRTAPCMEVRCPVNGNWGAWSISSCSVTCGTGQQVKTRLCNDPYPQYGGVECRGESQTTVSCKRRACSMIRRLPRRIILFTVSLLISFMVTIGLTCGLIISTVSKRLGRRSSFWSM